MTLSRLPLSYCTNVHPGRTVAEVIEGLTTYSAEVQRQLDFPMAAGLWLSASVIRELTGNADQMEQLAQVLWQHDLCCYTLNTFPYGDFHSERVKEQVYLPDWASSKRINYTEQCAAILGQLLPEGGEGSLSTVPLGGRMNPRDPDFHAVCFSHLIRLAKYLHHLFETTGRAYDWGWNRNRCVTCLARLHGHCPCSRVCLRRRKGWAVNCWCVSTSGLVSTSVIRRLSLKMWLNRLSSLSSAGFESTRFTSPMRWNS